MNFYFLTFAFGLLSITSFSQTWTKHGVTLSAANAIVADLSLPNETCGWGILAGFGQGVCGGAAPYFIRTVNGTTWNGGAISLPVDITPWSISAINKDTAWIAACNNSDNTSGYIYKTTNGGNNWTQQSTANSQDALRFVHFFNSNQGVAVGDSSTFITSDGGANWVFNGALPVPVAMIGSGRTIFLLNSYEVVGNTIWLGDSYGYFYKSTNQGMTWTLMSNAINSSIKGIAFKDTLHGMAVASRWNTGGGSGGGFAEDFSVMTSDGGASWQAMPILLNSVTVGSNAAKYDVAYVPGTTNTYIVGSEYDISSTFTAITTDGGLSWSLLDSTSQHTVVCFTSPTHGYTGGYLTDFASGIFKWSGNLPNQVDDHKLKNEIVCYPNPADEFIYIHSNDLSGSSHVMILVRDMTGKICLRQETDQLQRFQLDLRSLRDGPYMLSVLKDNQIQLNYSFIHHQ